MTEKETQSILTKNTVDDINNLVIVSILLGVCIVSFLSTFSHSYTGDGRLMAGALGLISLVFIIVSLEHLGKFRVEEEVE